MWKLLAVFALAVSLAVLPRTEASAKLLASKTLRNEYTVEGKDLTVVYSIYNVGSSSAQGVVLNDSSFSPSEFSVVKGMLSASWDRIPHNSNVTHAVILKPVVQGIYNISWGRITYTSEGSGDTLTSFSSAPGYIRVSAYPDFSRRHEAHIRDWLVFLALTTPTIALPLLLWYRSHSKYQKLKTKKQ